MYKIFFLSKSFEIQKKSHIFATASTYFRVSPEKIYF